MNRETIQQIETILSNAQSQVTELLMSNGIDRTAFQIIDNQFEELDATVFSAISEDTQDDAEFGSNEYDGIRYHNSDRV